MKRQHNRPFGLALLALVAISAVVWGSASAFGNDSGPRSLRHRVTSRAKRPCASVFRELHEKGATVSQAFQKLENGQLPEACAERLTRLRTTHPKIAIRFLDQCGATTFGDGAVAKCLREVVKALREEKSS